MKLHVCRNGAISSIFREKTIELRQQEKEKERIEQKRAKEKEFEERMAAINAQEAQRKEELQRNIKQKVKVHKTSVY